MLNQRPYEKRPNTKSFLICISRIWTEYKDLQAKSPYLDIGWEKNGIERTPNFDIFQAVICRSAFD